MIYSVIFLYFHCYGFHFVNKIIRKRHFVIMFSLFLVLTFYRYFRRAILDRRYEPSMLVCKPIQSNKLKIRMCQLDANSTKNEDVRVPHLKTTKTAVMTSFNVFFKIFEKMECFLLFSRVLYCNCNHSHQNRVWGIADIEMSKFPLFPLF